MKKLALLPLLYFLAAECLAKNNLSFFSARLLDSNFDAGFVKVRLDFSNGRFLQKGNRVFLWGADQAFDKYQQCSGSVVGKTIKYALLRLKNIKNCRRSINFTPGQLVSLRSDDLRGNIETVKELNIILNKKRLALSSRVKTLKDLIDGHSEKINAINFKYDTLIKKMNLEWKSALEKAQEEKIYNLQQFKNYAMRLDEVDFKIEQYLIEDDNFYTDRWSLDPSLYYKK